MFDAGLRGGGMGVTAERIRLGQAVISRAGRDAGRCYVVLALREDSRVAVADGTRRRVRNPKYKNPKHLQSVADPDPQLARKLSNGERITDAEVREVLRVLVEKGGCR